MKNTILVFSSLVLLSFTIGCGDKPPQKAEVAAFDIVAQIEYCNDQAAKTLLLIPNDSSSLPRNIAPDSKEWRFIKYTDWTSGFWPGTLWYLYEGTGNKKWEKEAAKYSRYLTPLSVIPAIDHDLGFQIYNSFGNGYRLTGNPEYKEIILKTADTLATLFNPNVGTILSWPREVPNMEWPQHNTIMDNMINLELLFWASKNGGDKSLYDLAVSHADVTMENHFRPDFTSYHVVIYDRETGEKIKAVTHQGYADDSMWARGQGWAIYGYTMVYRETGDEKYLDFAQKVAQVYLDRLPNDLIPYWDFNAPNIPDEPRDASAAALVASALLELTTLTKDADLAQMYADKAEKMLVELSDNYQSRDENSAFLLHSTGHKPGGTEIDYSINYADYYYVEALLRLQRLKTGKTLDESLLSVAKH
ncbi:glycoside hydrolase family 88 protein [Kriegella aquimaris]|uniref:Unsaturated chondroitin disaccharide hydrolase n=1 Tax=Kriegella aquimaris TaxID=192904 RepID=A0A1G9VAT8_9FLAO|nr:glycoside hydrolase family 88 protein [Kriegella aquimaris]SDM69312.1 unsaturated chondroitin disaccharide hydrolase [Kriegella aquimaris]